MADLLIKIPAFLIGTVPYIMYKGTKTMEIALEEVIEKTADAAEKTVEVTGKIAEKTDEIIEDVEMFLYNEKIFGVFFLFGVIIFLN